MQQDFRGIAAATIVAAALAVSAQVPQALAATATNLQCDGCVGTGDIGTGQVRARNLHASAKPSALRAGVLTGFVGNAADTTQLIRKVTIKVPGPGSVLASASVVVDRPQGGVFCKIDKADTAIVQADDQLYFGYRSSDATDSATVSGQNVFPVKGGKLRVYFLCRRISNASTPRYFNATLTALFVPSPKAIRKDVAGAAASGG